MYLMEMKGKSQKRSGKSDAQVEVVVQPVEVKSDGNAALAATCRM